MPSQVTATQRRIARDLRKGVTGHPENQLVYHLASDVEAILDALDAETQRADEAERKLGETPSLAPSP